MKLGIYVGSFNPVHDGHIKVINYILDNHLVDKVLVIPGQNYWDKQNLIDIKHRINMFKTFESEKIIVDDIHNNYPYTYQVFRSLKKDYPNDSLYLVMSTDNLINLDKWKNINELLQNKIIVLNRSNIDMNKYINKFNKDSFILVPDFDFINISSTEIRNGNYKYLNPKVKKYMEDNNLYK